MSWKWVSSSHPISDVRDWSKHERLEIRPDFQRKEVWSSAARILLMDTILRNIPMPKIFLQAVIRNNDTYRIVIDGQQRIKAILAFLRDEFQLVKPYTGEFHDLRFSQLPPNVQEDFLSYKMDINEIRNAPDDVIRDIYSRVNKYTVALNRQELRRADFPGEFLRLAEELATQSFFEENKVFTLANSKRMGDVEFVSELLALLLNGPQEKRESLDDFYLSHMEWDRQEREAVRSRFLTVLADLNMIFPQQALKFGGTRFRQKADFYSLFGAIDDCHREGGSIDAKPLEFLREDLQTIDANTAPEAEVAILRHYAVQCVSQGNSCASRKWRLHFLRHFLDGTYFQRLPSPEGIRIVHGILRDLRHPSMCSPPPFECSVCRRAIEDDAEGAALLAWPRSETVFQLSNAVLIHASCEKASEHGFRVVPRPDPTIPELPTES